MAPVDEIWLCEKNIQRFGSQLAQDPQGERSRLLRRLLMEEMAKLDELASTRKSDGARRQGAGQHLSNADEACGS